MNTREHDIDEAIDRTVRDMMDVEPSAALRARVMEQLAQPRSSFRWMWIAAPVAGFAVLVLAVWLGGQSPRVTSRPVSTIAELPAARTPRFVPAPIAPDAPITAPRPARRSRVPRPGAAASVAVVAEADESTVQPLAGPVPIVVARLVARTTMELSPVEPEPIQVKAIEVSPLPDVPRERQN
jgi:hypothetical protein